MLKEGQTRLKVLFGQRSERVENGQQMLARLMQQVSLPFS